MAAASMAFGSIGWPGIGCIWSRRCSREKASRNRPVGIERTGEITYHQGWSRIDYQADSPDILTTSPCSFLIPLGFHLRQSPKVIDGRIF